MAGAELQRSRSLEISARDTEGRPVAGLVTVRIAGVAAGSLQLSESHPAGMVELPLQLENVELVATFQGQRQSLSVTPQEQSYEFAFTPSLFKSASSPKAMAQCPDGKTGNPCVTCRIQGVDVRLCI